MKRQCYLVRTGEYEVEHRAPKGRKRKVLIKTFTHQNKHVPTTLRKFRQHVRRPR